MTYLVDANVISELRKGDRADRNVRSWFAGIADDEIFLSVVTLGEIRRGIESIRRRDQDAAAALDGWLSRLVAWHGDRILAIDRPIADEWGRLNVPDPQPVVDGLLVATAKVTGLTVATRNTRDVAPTGVPCVDPFAAQPR